MLNPTLQNNIDELLLSSKTIVDDVKLSMEQAIKAKKLSEKYFYTKGLANSLIQIGKNYQHISNYGEAMKTALEAMEICKGINDIKGESACLDILGGVYNFLGDYNKRLECNLACLVLRKQINDVPAQLSTLNNIGDTYMVMGDYENALKHFKQCLSFSDLSDSIQAIVYYNIGEVYFLKKEYTRANKHIDNGLVFGLASNYWQIIIACYEMKARILISYNQNQEALLFLAKAKEIALSKGNKEDEYLLYRYYSEAYGSLKQYQQAYFYLNKYKQLQEELSNENNAQKLKKIEFDSQFKSIKTEAKETKKKNKLLTRAFNQIEVQRNEIEEKNHSIIASIRYAKRIQNTILPSKKKIKSILKEAFVYYKPKDIVSGDFYWLDKIGDEIIFSVIDCTGHGVPGAFVSLIAHNTLDKIILEKKIYQPNLILAELDKIIVKEFTTLDGTIHDGMDIGICNWNTKTNVLQFSGAYHSLYYYDGETLNEIRGNREAIGYSLFNNTKEFTNHSLNVKNKDLIYLSSDGFSDQFGGVKGKKLKLKGFKSLLQNISTLTIKEQKIAINSFFNSWKGKLEQIDDVCVVGVKI